MDEKKEYRDWWERRDGVDLWSVPHLLFGVLMAIAPPFIGISSHAAFITTVIASIAWEIFEKFTTVKESLENIVFDVTFSIVGFLVASTLLLRYPTDRDVLVLAGLVFLALYAFTIFSGWRAYRRRTRGREPQT